MSAIIKTIPIHSDSVIPLMKYCANQQKTSVSQNLKENPDMNVSAALNYAANPLKTICNIDENQQVRGINVCERVHTRPCRHAHAGVRTHANASSVSPRCRDNEISVVVE